PPSLLFPYTTLFRSVCGAPAKPSTRSGMSAADTTVGCRKVRLPIVPYGSGSSLRNRSAGLPIAPAAAMKVLARTLIRRLVGSTPPRSSPIHDNELMRFPERSNLHARARVSNVAPRARAAGIDVTSIDCLALVGQPTPQ